MCQKPVVNKRTWCLSHEIAVHEFGMFIQPILAQLELIWSVDYWCYGVLITSVAYLHFFVVFIGENV